MAKRNKDVDKRRAGNEYGLSWMLCDLSLGAPIAARTEVIHRKVPGLSAPLKQARLPFQVSNVLSRIPVVI